ncbi:MAG: NFACT family protein [Desulfuromonadales bacterium]
MDSFFLEAIVEELQERLPGARIDKIFQPEAELLIFRLWNGRETVRLLLGAAAGQPRLHLTAGKKPNPFTPLRFCQLLRSRLSRITNIDKVPGERIVRFSCQGREGRPYLLVAELFGMHANLLLLDAQGIVIDLLKRNAGPREPRPGQPYRPPATPDRYFLSRSLPEIPTEASASADGFKRWLLENVSPMSPLVARDLSAAVANGAAAAEVLANFRREWQSRPFHPVVGHLAGQPVLTAFPLRHLSLAEVEEFSSPSAAADRFFSITASGGGMEKTEIRAVILRARQRLVARRKKVIEDLGRVGEADRERHLGELLLANMHRVQRGMPGVEVDDYYSDPPMRISIPLDPRLSPQENAERYFRGYKKKKKGVEHGQRRLAETEEEIAWVEEMTHFLDEAESRGDLQTIRGELAETGLLPRIAASRQRKSPDTRDSMRQALTPGGFQLWWGKSSRTNDYISREMTGAEDLWFHAHRLPGCHLVLKRSGRPEVPEADQAFAAAVAAGFSRGRDDSKVEVMIAEGKYVHKPKGARPGLVTVERYRTVLVQPRRPQEKDR